MDAAIVASTYLTHLADASAIPLGLIPSKETIAHAGDLIERVDGLLLLGGADVDPSFYGAEPQPALEATVPIRDRSEIALVVAAMERGVPVLGICRGLHIMNVATGGTLHQDIGAAAQLTHRRAPGHLDQSTDHRIDVVGDSRLGRALGAGLHDVNSHHHQAVDRLGRGATVTATSVDDGLIEAVEWDSPAFSMGVQWHPEAAPVGGIVSHFIDEIRRTVGERPSRTSGAND